MFRRQTDEVFSTLQQVQRRISQHTESGSGEGVVNPSVRRVTQPAENLGQGTGRPPGRPVSKPPRSRQPGSSPSRFQINPGGTAQPQHVVPVVDRSRVGQTAAVLGQGVGSAAEGEAYDDVGTGRIGSSADAARRPLYRRSRGLLLSPAVSLLVAVVVVAAVIGSYHLGARSVVAGDRDSAAVPAGGGAGLRDEQAIAQNQQQRAQQQAQSAAAAPTVTTAQRNRGTQTPAASAIRPLGDHVLVLESAARFSAAGAERFQLLADRYNELALEFADRGFQPWFGVRRPASGGLQLVFGALGDDVFGVARDDPLSERMFEDLRGSRFPSAFWVKIR
ncbi:MAG: hypothetical protein EA402_06380 [Planctomycetota bacterium]|nr:MAG: hypothetical protein EA402_06380 [Planctomycetota bacterium]